MYTLNCGVSLYLAVGDASYYFNEWDSEKTDGGSNKSSRVRVN